MSSIHNKKSNDTDKRKTRLNLRLDDKEFEVLRLSYGLDCDKHSANEIADLLNIEGPSSYVRISEIKSKQ